MSSSTLLGGDINSLAAQIPKPRELYTQWQVLEEISPGLPKASLEYHAVLLDFLN